MGSASVAELYPKIKAMAAGFEFRVFGCLDRQDLAQTAALEAHAAIQKAGDRSDDAVIGYALTKARWSMIDAFQSHLLRQQETTGIDGDWYASLPDPGGDVTAAAATRHQVAVKAWAIAERMPDRLREVMRGIYVEGLEQAEIGAALGVTQSRVSQLHSEAIRLIRADLGVTP